MGLELGLAQSGEKPPPITDQWGMLSGEEKTRELAVMQNKNTIGLVGLDGPGVGRACSTS